MRWSWRIFALFGIDIKVHATFFLALVWGGFLWSEGGWGGALYGVFLTLVLFVIVIMHELGHSLMARRQGIPVHDILLLPIGGVARLSGAPMKPRDELLIALAGPAVNLALMLLVAPLVAYDLLFGWLRGAPLVLPHIGSPGWANFLAFLLVVNFMLFVFNMLPAFPMDGGRVLRSLMAMRLSHVRATRVAALVGRLFAIGFGAVGLMTGNIFLAVVGLFVFAGAGAEGRENEEPVAVEAAPSPLRDFPVLLADTPGHLAFERLVQSPHAAVAVVSQQGEFVGVVTRRGMERLWAAGVRGPLSSFIDGSF
jgi:Zn-dependent protease